MTDFSKTLERYVGIENIRLHWYFGYQEGVSPSEAVHYTSEGKIVSMDGQTLVFENNPPRPSLWERLISWWRGEEPEHLKYSIMNLADVMIPVIDVRELVE